MTHFQRALCAAIGFATPAGARECQSLSAEISRRSAASARGAIGVKGTAPRLDIGERPRAYSGGPRGTSVGPRDRPGITGREIGTAAETESRPFADEETLPLSEFLERLPCESAVDDELPGGAFFRPIMSEWLLTV